MILAYIDGGSGAMALQLLIAGAMSVVYAFRTRWQRFVKRPRMSTYGGSVKSHTSDESDGKA